MARTARIVIPGSPHHVTQRGNRRQPTFFCDSDYSDYIALMADWCDRVGVEVWAYCLMPNHVHLIAVPSSPEVLARAIGEAHRCYSRRVNARNEWRGHLWQDRFSSYVMDEPYLLAAVRYVEMNPVRAGLAGAPWQYRWSSARAHVAGADDPLVRVRPLLDIVGGDWRQFITQQIPGEGAEVLRRHESTGRPLGDDLFVGRLEEAVGKSLRPGKRGPKPARISGTGYLTRRTARVKYPVPEILPAELTPRERVRLALEHQVTDRVPIAMVCSGLNPPAHAELERHLQATRGISVKQYLDPIIDIGGVGPPYIGPALAPGTDIWGVRRAPVSYGPASYDEIAYYPLADAMSVDDLRAYPWPSPDWFDFAALPAAIAQARRERDLCLMIANGNILETAWYMRGLQQMMVDFVLAPEFAHELLARVAAFHTEFFRRALAAADGGIDLAFTADDIGGQNGLLMSLPMWEEFIKPHHARLNAVIHKHGVRVIYHSDGAVMEAVPGLVDMGIDVLQALQFDAAGMNPVALKSAYGDRLCFEGGVSVQSTLPFGTADDVADEVRVRIDVLGRGGGYILGPSHAIQAGTPPENVVALFDTALTHPLSG